MKYSIKSHPENPGEGEVLAAFSLSQRPGGFYLPFKTEDGKTIEMSIEELGPESGQPGMLILGGVIKGTNQRYSGFYNARNRGPGFPDTEKINLFGQPVEKLFGPVTSTREGALGARPR